MARPAAPPAMARPGAPPAMARPAAPPRPAMAPRPTPHIAAPPPRPTPHVAAPSRPAAPRVATPPQRPAMAPRPTPHIATPSRPSTPPTVSERPPRQQQIEQRAQQREQRIQQQKQIVQDRQRETLSRQTADRQGRIDRLQQRVQQLQSQKAEGPRAQRAQERLLQTQSRLLQREQRMQQQDQARMQQLGPAERPASAQERQREMLSRQSAERQTRIDRLQQRVQQLQSQKVEGPRAQRAQERLLQAQNRLLQREQFMQRQDQARLQSLGPEPTTVGRAASVASVAAAARGRFAAQFRSNDALQPQAALTAREQAWAPRHAWRHGKHAVFVAWLGPVFWPYAYSDIFNYTFWPYAYEPGYWAYAYDDFVDTVFWGADSRYSAYARSPDPGAPITEYRGRGRPSASPEALRQVCEAPDKGVTAWPIADITRAVQPTPEQRALLDELKIAAAKAADVFKQSCGESYALTPPGRLRAMTDRITATLEAVRIVRPALERFYDSLNDEQKARFNALGPNVGDRSQQQPQREASEACGDPKSSLTQLPIERIEAVIRPAGKQKDALDRLSNATKKAVAGLQAACPDEVPLTPVGRLEAMEKRLEAMLEAADWVQARLDEFYATLSSEQKARFNTLQQTAGQ
ncbi:Spy/CpxP family protein refolding chaperone [Bradyrhizobium elkanii]|uniref:Spy/CpxP family protein refolding chaperone n=1 Tax=Bradyrhizobium elkanii TaxID=29448 RepID=UPI0024BF7633|nr:Spy/CpxP family protein refolding chaperone [Bradyrhizobium elkanii]